MENAKVLYINQEVYPYVRESREAMVGRYLPQAVQEAGSEIRMFTPRFGCINERRNQLHEVLRLSGMNIVINEADHPLIIKVSSIQAARMQIYFIDNEEYFHKKNMLVDKNNAPYADTDEKLIFFARGVLEAIKKLSWIPDIVHCNGWFTSLVPYYIRKAYRDHPSFLNVKILTSVFPGKGYEGPMSGDLMERLRSDKMATKELGEKYAPFTYEQLCQFGVDDSDGVVMTAKSAHIAPPLAKAVTAAKKPTLTYPGEATFAAACGKFYEKFVPHGK
ncbi:MAG: glycogen/starch synthase [Bacteroidales bacterium]|nr:glycogen/starch synthase [Bacteroidales bacterium]